MLNSNSVPIDHKSWCNFVYTEEFKFSANGKNLYCKRTFQNGQELNWVYDSACFPLDEGMPSSARAYAAVKAAKR